MSIKNNRTMSVVFISTCAIFLLFLFLMEWDYLCNLSYRLHEFCALFVNAGLFLIPLEFVIGIVLWINYRLEKDEKPLVNALLNTASVIVFFICISTFVFWMNGITTFGSTNEIGKQELNHGYFLHIDDKLFEVSQGQYDSLQLGKWYSFEYKHNNLIPNKYTLVNIREFH